MTDILDRPAVDRPLTQGARTGIVLLAALAAWAITILLGFSVWELARILLRSG